MPGDGSVVLLRGMVLGSAPRCGDVRVVCIDGPAGSGKTTLAAAVADAVGGATVVHLDDLYDGWDQELGERLSARVRAWLLDPWSVGLSGRHLRFDWHAARYTEWVEVPTAPVVILEGCGSAAAGIRDRAAVIAWVEADQDVRLARGVARDGDPLTDQWAAWQRRETQHYAADRTAAAAHVVVRT